MEALPGVVRGVGDIFTIRMPIRIDKIREGLIRFRMDKAAAMLKKTDMSVSDVAAAVGYGDQLAFSKIFKQYYGESPRAFRESEDKLVLCAHKGEFERKDIF